MKPKLLDLFSGAGGATRGYQLAGFYVTGVDIAPQPRYVGEVFVQGDALEYLAAHGHEFDAIHASPPCQSYSTLEAVNRGAAYAEKYPKLVLPLRELLQGIGKPYVIENVPGAGLHTSDDDLGGRQSARAGSRNDGPQSGPFGTRPAANF